MVKNMKNYYFYIITEIILWFSIWHILEILTYKYLKTNEKKLIIFIILILLIIGLRLQ